MPTFGEYRAQIDQVELELRANSIEASLAQKLFDTITAAFRGDAAISFPEQMALTRSIPAVEITAPTTVFIEEMRKKNALGLLGDWLTRSITSGGESQASALKVLREKIQNFRQGFVDAGNAAGKPEAESVLLWQDFCLLVEETFTLGEFGIMRSDVVNRTDMTAIHDKILDSAKKDGAMAANQAFNKNRLVQSTNMSQKTLAAPNMGLVHKIVCVAFQEMRKKNLSTADALTPAHQTGQDPLKSVFSRNQTFTSETATNLIEVVCQSDTFRALDSPAPVNLGIASELSLFPPEAQDMIKSIALWKACRDDIGSRAAMWHLGKNKGAMKYSKGTGTPGRPEGLLSAILYQVGKNSSNDYHRAVLNFIDPTSTELMTDGRPPDEVDYTKENKWDEHVSPQNHAVVFAQEYETRLNEWATPTWKKVPRTIYKPDDWHADFPSLADFFNQGATAPIDGAKYLSSRDAVLWIIEAAANSQVITLDATEREAEEKAMVVIKDFASKIGEAMNYIGPHAAGGRYEYVHKLMLAAFQYYITNIMLAVPGKIGWTGNSNITAFQYNRLFNIVRTKVHETISLNTTLRPYYYDNVIGNGFLNSRYLKRARRFDIWERNKFQGWVIRRDPGIKKSGFTTKAEIKTKNPSTRINTSRQWQSSYEEVVIQHK